MADLAARGSGRARPPSAAAAAAEHAAPPGELPANALVADLGEGLEAVHLYSGRPLCALALAAPGLHADVNGDGVLDHVHVRALPCALNSSDVMRDGATGRQGVASAVRETL